MRNRLAMPSSLAYPYSMSTSISSHFAKIGRRGGLASTPAKREAARRNALKRWGKTDQVIPVKSLQDGEWYWGRGRNSSIGIWDNRAVCFWVIAFNDFANPASFPSIGRRQVRLKREDYIGNKNGTFAPIRTLGKESALVSKS